MDEIIMNGVAPQTRNVDTGRRVARSGWDKMEQQVVYEQVEYTAEEMLAQSKLDTTGGDTALAYLGDTPWHKGGQLMTGDESRNLELAMAKGMINYRVELGEAYVKIGEKFVRIPGGHATYRADTEAVFGSVKDRYRVIQNTTGLGNGALQQLLDEGLVQILTAGAMYGGRQVWVQTLFNAKSPLIQQVFGDTAVPTGVFYNAHDGSRLASVFTTWYRIICRNTLRMGRNAALNEIKVRHTGQADQKMDRAARSLWANLFSALEKQAAEAAVLQAVHLTEAELGRLVLDLCCPPSKEPSSSAMGLAMERKRQERRDRIAKLWDEGDGHEGRRTAYEAMNAVAQTFDHDTQLWGRRDNVDARLLSHTTGTFAQTKVKVADRLLAHCLEASEGVTMLDRILRFQDGGSASLLNQIVAAQ